MARHTSGWAAVAAALLLVLAGCTGGVTSGPSGSDAGTAAGDDGGTVDFYISDQQNAIDQFEHLNVTITEVTLVRADADGNETETTESDADGNETETAESTETPESDDAVEGERVTYEVDNVSLDLTELQGANASKLGSVPVPNGTYTKVFVEVESVDGTLTDGSSADVKLPSDKLRLNTEFTVGNGEAVDFVFDVTVFERGNQGYILKPVAGESGTGDEVEIRDVDGDDSDGAETDDEGTEESETGTDDGSDGDESASDGANASDGGENASDGADESGQSSMNFYLSDEENAMGDFAHLDVTVTKVGLQRGGESGGWVETDVDDRTVDLTTLPGANATKLGTFGVENGTYTKVFVSVDAIDATLENGDSTNVKLPSNTLQLNTEFTVGDGEDVDFVYDMSVFETGNSGKYILKPVVGESGTGDEVEIDDVDDDNGADEADEADDDENADDGGGPALNASFSGTVTAGETATVAVTRNGSAVENATVTVEQTLADGETTATYGTDANGTATFPVDATATAVTVEVAAGDDEVDLEREVDDADASGSDNAALRAAV